MFYKVSIPFLAYFETACEASKESDAVDMAWEKFIKYEKDGAIDVGTRVLIDEDECGRVDAYVKTHVKELP